MGYVTDYKNGTPLRISLITDRTDMATFLNQAWSENNHSLTFRICTMLS